MAFSGLQVIPCYFYLCNFSHQVKKVVGDSPQTALPLQFLDSQRANIQIISMSINCRRWTVVVF